jgi:peptidoglycan/xylan/chitin deacetylase (PgdA/CDA1 family)
MSVAFRVALCASLSMASFAQASVRPLVTEPKQQQFVIISFDGAHDIAQWQRSRTLAARTGARFTYFLSCVFLLTRDTRREYQGPGMQPGKSNVGFAQSKKEVADRLEEIRLAASEGNEIASHGCGHFDGGKWTRDDWLEEFASFRHIIRDAYTINSIANEPAGWRAFVDTSVTGFRAPYLSTGKSLYDALKIAGFTYDASGVSRGPTEPVLSDGVEQFSLPMIPEGPKQHRVIAMDYNLFVRHSDGVERLDEGAAFQERAYQAFLAAFEAQYEGKRIPLQLGFHFTLMNDGAYWKALERFAEEVCIKPGVTCTSYSDYLARTRNADDKPQSAAIGG